MFRGCVKFVTCTHIADGNIKSWHFSKCYTGLPYDPLILLLGIPSGEMKKTYAHTKTNLYVNVHSSIIHKSQKVETNDHQVENG